MGTGQTSTAAIADEPALAIAKTAINRIEELETRLDEKDEIISELESRVIDLEQENAILNAVSNASQLSVDVRAAICVKTLYNKAKRKEREGYEPVASMDYNGANDALGGGLDRRQLLDALQRAVELAAKDEGNNVLEYKKEPRGANRNTRLILDLTNGTLPRTVAGERITEGGL